MKQILYILISLLLIGCKPSEEELAEIAQLKALEDSLEVAENENDSLLTKSDSLEVVIDDWAYRNNEQALGFVQAEVDFTYFKYALRQTKRGYKAYQGNYHDLLLSQSNEMYVDSFEQHHEGVLRWAKSLDGYYRLPGTYSENPDKFIFECFGRVAGEFFYRANYDSVYTLFQNRLDHEILRNPLVDMFCDRGFALLEKNWSTTTEKRQLQNALSYVLATSKNVDYSASVKNGIYTNREYEEGWNELQKFFYRANKKVPGSIERIQYNVQKYLDKNFSEEEFEEIDILTELRELYLGDDTLDIERNNDNISELSLFFKYEAPGKFYNSLSVYFNVDNEYQLYNRLMYANSSLSQYYANSTDEAYFDFLGDRFGLFFGSNAFLNVIRFKLNGDEEKLFELVDYCSQYAFTVLEMADDEAQEHGNGGIYRDALRRLYYVSAEVDYDAKLIQRSDYKDRFANDYYEENWTGSQKFLYRLENHFPGSVERVRLNIAEYLGL